MGEGVFTVHFGVPAPYCWIAGRAHSSPGNVCAYLVYRRNTPSKSLLSVPFEVLRVRHICVSLFKLEHSPVQSEKTNGVS
jgi:hypothetical protein